ncbi:MAG: hypothetical protein ACE10E_08880 [Acidiferrobacterales bacterium]
MTGTPVAGLILIHPGIQVKAIEGNALFADRDFSELGPYLGIEPIAVHAEIVRRVSQAQETGRTVAPHSHPEYIEQWRARVRASICASLGSLR